MRPARPDDAAACLALRGLTRENAISRADLAARGITEESWRADIGSGRLPGYVCCDAGGIVGYCFGDRETGEVVVLALLPGHEGKGLGKALLSRVAEHLHGLGFRRLFLEASADPVSRSHGFYRHLGWQPTGEAAGHGDEVLALFLAP
ncbi:GNAT family N-acetyltransferase [Roseibacterium sp. SDUM158016]|nr:GNAT family N-acetyltransferase [Roseibacterium sp. SDUM158016]